MENGKVLQPDEPISGNCACFTFIIYSTKYVDSLIDTAIHLHRKARCRCQCFPHNSQQLTVLVTEVCSDFLLPLTTVRIRLRS